MSQHQLSSSFTSIHFAASFSRLPFFFACFTSPTYMQCTQMRGSARGRCRQLLTAANQVEAPHYLPESSAVQPHCRFFNTPPNNANSLTAKVSPSQLLLQRQAAATDTPRHLWAETRFSKAWSTSAHGQKGTWSAGSPFPNSACSGVAFQSSHGRVGTAKVNCSGA